MLLIIKSKREIMDAKILSVLVLYHCKLQDSRTYVSFKPDNRHLLIFDNSENPQDISSFAPEAVYIHNDSNIGLSACYNRAAKYAKENGYDWMLFLDQDTDFSEVSVTDYEKAIPENTECQMFVPMVKCGEFTMSPMLFLYHFAKLSNYNFQGVVDAKKISVINSGLCISLAAFETCGGYNENVFLDYSDHEFVRRYKRKFKYIYVLSNSVRQNFSAQSDGKLQSLSRFRLFCRSIKGCEKNGMLDEGCFAFVVIKRALSLTLQFKTFSSFSILFHNYFKI